METIRDSVRGKEARAKQKVKERYDRSARERKFVEGDMVLIRTPGMSSKLDEAWDGPYEVLRAVNKVTYEIAVPGCRSKRKIVHVNRCKQWHPAEASVLRIVVATEEEEEEGKTRLSGRVLEAKQVKELLEILNKYQDVRPGMMKDVEHSIDTGNATPIRSLPYRLCPAWREKVREELKKLLEDGITEPSRSP